MKAGDTDNDEAVIQPDADRLGAKLARSNQMERRAGKRREQAVAADAEAVNHPVGFVSREAGHVNVVSIGSYRRSCIHLRIARSRGYAGGCINSVSGNTVAACNREEATAGCQHSRDRERRPCSKCERAVCVETVRVCRLAGRLYAIHENKRAMRGWRRRWCGCCAGRCWRWGGSWSGAGTYAATAG